MLRCCYFLGIRNTNFRQSMRARERRERRVRSRVCERGDAPCGEACCAYAFSGTDTFRRALFVMPLFAENAPPRLSVFLSIVAFFCTGTFHPRWRLIYAFSRPDWFCCRVFNCVRCAHGSQPPLASWLFLAVGRAASLGRSDAWDIFWRSHTRR